MARVPSPPHGLTDETPFPPDCSARYAPVRRLARGGFGQVFLARHRDLERTVVIKLLLGHLLEETEQVERFRQEARITAALRHPNLVQVFDFGAQYGIPWIAYEYVEGRTLRDILDAGELSFDRALEAVSQVSEALEEAHARGVLHRDVKPDNVLVDSAGRCRVTDFGIAKWAREGAVETRTGLVLGTPAYVSPEQIRGEDATMASDLYALGVMLHELVTGRQPFVADGPLGVLELHLRGPLPRPTDSRPDLPAGINRVVARAMAKAVADRHGSLGELREDLQQLIGADAHESARTMRLRTAPSHGATRKRGAGILVAAVLVALAIALASRDGRQSSIVEATSASPHEPPRLRAYGSLTKTEKDELKRFHHDKLQPLGEAQQRLETMYHTDPTLVLSDPVKRAHLMDGLRELVIRVTSLIHEVRGRWEYDAYVMMPIIWAAHHTGAILEDLRERGEGLESLHSAGVALRDELEEPASGPLLRGLRRELGSRVQQLLAGRVETARHLTGIRVDTLEEILDHLDGFRAPDAHELSVLIDLSRRALEAQTSFLMEGSGSEVLAEARQAGKRLYRVIVVRVTPFFMALPDNERREVSISLFLLNMVARFTAIRDLDHEARRTAFRRALEIAALPNVLANSDAICPDCVHDAGINLREAAKKFGPLSAAESSLLERLERVGPPR